MVDGLSVTFLNALPFLRLKRLLQIGLFRDYRIPVCDYGSCRDSARVTVLDGRIVVGRGRRGVGIRYRRDYGSCRGETVVNVRRGRSGPMVRGHYGSGGGGYGRQAGQGFGC